MRRDTGRVYAIINRVTGRTYIGSTVKTVTERFSAHRSRLNVGMHENPALQADWRQFGSAAFDVVELETVHYPGSNLHQEEYWIRTYRERGTDLYNSRAIFSAAPPRLERPNASAAALARRRWRNRTEDKVCPFCKQPFKGDKRQTYCTPAHQNAAAVRRFRERERRQGAARTGEFGHRPLLALARRADAPTDKDGLLRWLLCVHNSKRTTRRCLLTRIPALRCFCNSYRSAPGGTRALT